MAPLGSEKACSQQLSRSSNISEQEWVNTNATPQRILGRRFSWLPPRSGIGLSLDVFDMTAKSVLRFRLRFQKRLRIQKPLRKAIALLIVGNFEQLLIAHVLSRRWGSAGVQLCWLWN